jgi:hypothetical protein
MGTSFLAGVGYLALYLVNVFSVTLLIDKHVPESASPWVVLFGILPPTAFLLIICFIKGEKPRWRWGKD